MSWWALDIFSKKRKYLGCGSWAGCCQQSQVRIFTKTIIFQEFWKKQDDGEAMKDQKELT